MQRDDLSTDLRPLLGGKQTRCIGSVWEQTAAAVSAMIVTQARVRDHTLVMYIMGGYESKRCPGLIATHVLVKEEERGGRRAASSWLSPVFFRLDGMVAAKCFVGGRV